MFVIYIMCKNDLLKNGRGITVRAYYNNIIYLTMLLLGSLALASLNQTVPGGDSVAAYTHCSFVGGSTGTVEPAATTSRRLKGSTDAAATAASTAEATVITAEAAVITAEAAVITAEDKPEHTHSHDHDHPVEEEDKPAECVHPHDGLTEEDEDQNNHLFNITVAIVVINTLAFVWSIAAHWDDFIELQQKSQWVVSIINLGLFAGNVGWLMSQDGLLDALNDNNIFLVGLVNVYAVNVVGLIFSVLDFVLFGILDMAVFKGECTYKRASSS